MSIMFVQCAKLVQDSRFDATIAVLRTHLPGFIWDEKPLHGDGAPRAIVARHLNGSELSEAELTSLHDQVDCII